MRILIKWTYNLLGIILIPFFYLFSFKKGFKLSLKERFVFYKENQKHAVWFHCASVGELNVAKPLIEYYRQKYPILITVFSPRGKFYAKRLYPYAKVYELPFDISFIVKKFLKVHSPKILLNVEGEFWFNLVDETSKKTNVISVNTRISPKSFKIYKKFFFFYRYIFENISLFLARSEKDVSFLKELVDNKKKIVLCGDLKLVSSAVDKDVYLKTRGKILIVAGSTHYPEESILLSIYKKIKRKYPDTALVIAPRHLERVREVENLLKEEGFSYSLRSKSDEIIGDVYVVDTLGELPGIYKYAKVVFVGGTIAPVGGHNILEPALLSKPVIIGNNYEKIEDIFKYLSKIGAVVSVSSDEELEKYIIKALEGEFKPKIDLVKEQEEIFNCYVKNIDRYLEKEVDEKDSVGRAVLHR